MRDKVPAMRRLPSLLFVCVLFRASPAQEKAYPPPADVKAAFLKLLDRPKVPLDVKSSPGTAAGAALALTGVAAMVDDGGMSPVPIPAPSELR